MFSVSRKKSNGSYVNEEAKEKAVSAIIVIYMFKHSIDH